MTTYDFEVATSGHVRIDADSEEAATEEFVRTFAQEAVLVTAQQDQLIVLDGIVWQNPTVYVPPVEDIPEDEEETKETDGEEV